MKIYLAGPEVFLPDPHTAAEKKKQLCADYGFTGVFPLDAELDLSGLTPQEQGLRISEANEKLIAACDLVIANLTPFRGPSADVGTVYECGLARGLGLPVYGYSNVAALFEERTAAFFGLPFNGSELRDAQGMQVEAFGLRDNLMIDGGIILSKGVFVTQDVPEAERFTNLEGFEACLKALEAIGGKRGKPFW